MNEEIKYWKWKNTILDFNTISDENIDCNDYIKKKDYVFKYLGIPDNNIHEWYNGGYSCEYNSALEYAKELGLVEDYIDYEDEIYNLKEENKQLKDKIKQAVIYIKNIDESEFINTEHYIEILNILEKSDK